MQEHAKSRTAEAVPNNDATRQLSEEDKRKMELQDHAEHQIGEAKEQAVDKAQSVDRDHSR